LDISEFGDTQIKYGPQLQGNAIFGGT